MEENHVFDDLAGYALGSLEADEQIKVELHLEHCAECQAELARYQTVNNLLGLAVPQHNPPAALKNRLLLQVETSQKASQKSSWRPQTLESRPRRVLVAWSIASAALVIVLGVVSLSLWRQIKAVQHPYGYSFNSVALVSPVEYSPASGVILISQDGARGAVVVDKLVVLDPGSQYQLWLIKDGERTSGGVFSVTRDGYGVLQVESTLPLASYQEFGITVEPAGGSPKPTGEKVLGGEL